MEVVKLNFLKKSSMEEKYGKIRRMLIKNGYKHINTNVTYSFSCKESKRSNMPTKKNKYRVYPFTITIKSNTTI